MGTVVHNCPRCGSRQVTLDCLGSTWVAKQAWMNLAEAFFVCRACHSSCILLLRQRQNDKTLESWLESTNGLENTKLDLTNMVQITNVLNKIDVRAEPPPDHLPPNIREVFLEANRCLVAECWNAAAAMYRLVLDLSTKSILPNSDEPNANVRRSLGLRLQWLFDNGKLPVDLKELSTCIQQDGNDGAHDGTLTQEDAEDLRDFCFELTRRLFTEPERVRLAEERRKRRRAEKA